MTQPTEIISSSLLRQRHSFGSFVGTVVFSLLLHFAASVVFILPGRSTPASAPPFFLELQNLVETPSPVTIPTETEATDKQPQSPAAESAMEQAPAPAPETAKLENAVANSLRRAVQTPEAVHESTIGLGMTSGHFASFAEGATLKDEIRVYYFDLMRRINEAWWTSGAARSPFANSAAINMRISREGSVLGCELLQSSGNREHDKALLAAVKAAGPLPPLPKSYMWPTFDAPIRFVPPLRLMLPGFSDKINLEIRPGN